MINMATDEAMLLHMHQGLISPCDQESEGDKDDDDEEEEKGQCNENGCPMPQKNGGEPA